MDGLACIVIDTGQPLEFQSGATPGALIENVRRNPQTGVLPEQVEERQMTYADYMRLVREWERSPGHPSRLQADAKRAERDARRARIRVKLSLTDAELDDLLALSQSPE